MVSSLRYFQPLDCPILLKTYSDIRLTAKYNTKGVWTFLVIIEFSQRLLQAGDINGQI